MTIRSESVTFAEIESMRRAEESTHICGACRTPWGRSALPCKNDPDRKAT